MSRLVWNTRSEDSLRCIGIGPSGPLLIRVLPVASVNLQHIAVRDLPVRKVDALFGATPLEGRICHGDPLLVFVAVYAGPDLEFRAVCVNTARNVDTLDQRQVKK